MSLKILVVPALIIAILVIGIGYLKPSIGVLFEKKSTFDQTVGQADQLDTVVKNIQSMKSQLAASSEDVDFLKQYIPGQSDVEKEIDQLNYLASKSGVAVKDIQVVEIKKPVVTAAPPVEAGPTSSATALFGDTSMNASLPTSVKKTYTPETYTISIKSIGSYEATKSFMANVMQSHRFLRVAEASLGSAQSTEGVGAAASKQPSNLDGLESMLTVEFAVLPTLTVDSALGDAAFDKPKLSFDTVSGIRMHSDGDAPMLPKADTGKTNLFQ